MTGRHGARPSAAALRRGAAADLTAGRLESRPRSEPGPERRRRCPVRPRPRWTKPGLKPEAILGAGAEASRSRANQPAANTTARRTRAALATPSGRRRQPARNRAQPFSGSLSSRSPATGRRGARLRLGQAQHAFGEGGGVEVLAAAQGLFEALAHGGVDHAPERGPEPQVGGFRGRGAGFLQDEARSSALSSASSAPVRSSSLAIIVSRPAPPQVPHAHAPAPPGASQSPLQPGGTWRANHRTCGTISRRASPCEALRRRSRALDGPGSEPVLGRAFGLRHPHPVLPRESGDPGFFVRWRWGVKGFRNQPRRIGSPVAPNPS